MELIEESTGECLNILGKVDNTYYMEHSLLSSCKIILAKVLTFVSHVYDKTVMAIGAFKQLIWERTWNQKNPEIQRSTYGIVCIHSAHVPHFLCAMHKVLVPMAHGCFLEWTLTTVPIPKETSPVHWCLKQFHIVKQFKMSTKQGLSCTMIKTSIIKD